MSRSTRWSQVLLVLGHDDSLYLRFFHAVGERPTTHGRMGPMRSISPGRSLDRPCRGDFSALVTLNDDNGDTTGHRVNLDDAGHKIAAPKIGSGRLDLVPDRAALEGQHLPAGGHQRH